MVAQDLLRASLALTTIREEAVPAAQDLFCG